MKPRNSTPSGNPAKPTAQTGSDDVSRTDDEAVDSGADTENGTSGEQMEFQEDTRPKGPIRLRPPTRPGGLASRMSSGGDAEHSTKQYQRTIDELNRRIIALEGTQRERAQELAKEKEIRLKTERQLAAAERALQESAAIVESTRAEAKREIDTEIRKRDSETGRQSKDQQKAVAELQEEVLRLQAELEEARGRAEQRTSEVPGDAAAWEARAIAQFEEDIDNYRTRIKALIQERDAISKEKDRLAEALASGGGTQPAEADAEPKAELQELRKQNDKLNEQISALREEAEKATVAAGAAAPGGDADSQKLSAELRRVENERDLAQAEAEKLMAEIDGIRELRRQDQEKLERERAANQFNKESGAISLRKTIDVQQKAIASITKERDEISRLHDALQSDLADTSSARQQLLEEVEALRTEMEAIRESAARAADEIRHEHDATLARLHKEHEEALALAARRQSEVEADRADLFQQLSGASGRIADLQSRLADAERELRQAGDALARQEQSLTGIAEDRDRTVRELEEKHANEIAALRQEKADLDAEARAFIANLREEHAREVAEMTRSESEIVSERNRQVGELRAELEALQQRAAAQVADAERAAEQAVNSVRIQMDQQIADRDRQMTEILNALAEAREGRQADNTSFSGEFKALMKQRDDALAEVQRARAEVQRRAEEIQEFKNDSLKSSDELRARAEREILRLQREREQLIKQRDEFRNRVKQLADQQRRLMEEIANDPFRSLGSHRLPEPAPVFIEPISTKSNAPSDAPASEEGEPANAADSANETILERPEPAAKPETPTKPNIPLPRARPATPPPPQVRRGS